MEGNELDNNKINLIDEEIMNKFKEELVKAFEASFEKYMVETYGNLAEVKSKIVEEK